MSSALPSRGSSAIIFVLPYAAQRPQTAVLASALLRSTSASPAWKFRASFSSAVSTRQLPAERTAPASSFFHWAQLNSFIGQPRNLSSPIRITTIAAPDAGRPRWRAIQRNLRFNGRSVSPGVRFHFSPGFVVENDLAPIRQLVDAIARVFTSRPPMLTRRSCSGLRATNGERGFRFASHSIKSFWSRRCSSSSADYRRQGSTAAAHSSPTSCEISGIHFQSIARVIPTRARSVQRLVNAVPRSRVAYSQCAAIQRALRAQPVLGESAETDTPPCL